MKKRTKLPAVLVLSAIMLICLAIDFITGGMLNQWFGIVPRDSDYLLGILMHPFAHFGIGHFISNFSVFIVLGFFLRLSYSNNQIYLLFFSLAILGGIFTWIFASKGLHGGASGVVFGMWSSLITFAVKRRKIKDIIIGITIAIMYGASFILGVIPQRYISFEGHFFGIVAGILISLLVIKFERKKM